MGEAREAHTDFGDSNGSRIAGGGSSERRPKPSWRGLMGINLGMTRKDVEARFGPGVPNPFSQRCLVMDYPMPDERSAVIVGYTSSVCTRSRDAVVTVSTRNRFAALPDGVRVDTFIPSPLKRSRW